MIIFAVIAYQIVAYNFISEIMNIWNSYIWTAEWKAWFFQAFFSQLHKLR